MRPALLSLLLLIACGGARAQLKRGDAYLADGHPEAASRAYARGLELRPDDPEVHAKLARALLGAGQDAEALGHARVARAAEVDGAELLLVQALLANGLVDEAFPLARAAMEDAPSPESFALLGEAELARGAPDRAATWLRRGAPEDTPRVGALLAWALVHGDDEDAAITQLVAAQALAYGEVESSLILAAGWLHLGRTQEASGLGNEVRSVQPRTTEPGALRDQLIDRSQRRREVGDRLGGYLDALSAFALSPDDARLASGIGSWYLADDDPSRARAWLEAALDLPPYATTGEGDVQRISASGPSPEELVDERVAVAQDLSRAYLALGETGRAAEALEIAVLGSGVTPTAEGYLALAEAYAAARRTTEAAEFALRAADMGHPEATLWVSRAAAEAGRMDEAVARANAAWRANPSDIELALLLAELYMRRDEPAPAENVLRTTLASNPDHPDLIEVLEAIEASTGAPNYEALFGGAP